VACNSVSKGGSLKVRGCCLELRMYSRKIEHKAEEAANLTEVPNIT
jgi:hypothetical protein